MKHILLTTLFLMASILVKAQCEPQTDFGKEAFGIAPDTIQNFASGEIGQVYVQQIDFKIPVDGSFLNFPFVSIDSVLIMGIFGLPSGLSLSCASHTDGLCTYLPGMVGCALISGVPEEEGIFDLQIVLSFHTNFGEPVSFPFSNYSIVIGNPLGVDNLQSTEFELLPNTPNPADDHTVVFFNAPHQGTATISVFDLVGKLVVQRNVQAYQGLNKIKLNTADYHQGIYILRLEFAGQSMSQRLVVTR